MNSTLGSVLPLAMFCGTVKKVIAFTNEHFSTCTYGQTKVKIRDIGLQSDSRAEHAALRLVIFAEEKGKVFIKKRSKVPMTLVSLITRSTA